MHPVVQAIGLILTAAMAVIVFIFDDPVKIRLRPFANRVLDPVFRVRPFRWLSAHQPVTDQPAVTPAVPSAPRPDYQADTIDDIRWRWTWEATEAGEWTPSLLTPSCPACDLQLRPVVAYGNPDIPNCRYGIRFECDRGDHEFTREFEPVPGDYYDRVRRIIMATASRR